MCFYDTLAKAGGGGLGECYIISGGRVCSTVI